MQSIFDEGKQDLLESKSTKLQPSLPILLRIDLFTS